MKPNPIRERCLKGETVYGTMIQDVRTTAIGQIMAQAGVDFLFFDMEHGPFDISAIADMVKVTRLTSVTPFVRVPNDQYHLMARVLDAGARGIMIPRIETRQQVEDIVSNTHYPPVGVRGCSVDKGHNDFEPQKMWEFTEQANQENMIILQIERAKAIENIDDLLSVEGVDAAILGPNDLALSMGVHEKDELAALEPAIQSVLDSARRHNIPCGIHVGNIDWLIEWAKRGMQLITYSNDIVFLRNGAATGIKKIKEGINQA